MSAADDEFYWSILILRVNLPALEETLLKQGSKRWVDFIFEYCPDENCTLQTYLCSQAAAKEAVKSLKKSLDSSTALIARLGKLTILL